MPTVTAFGTALYYEKHGSGPALVFAHGGGGSHLSWWQQVPAFRDRYTCVTFDHRGFGQSLDPRPVEERPRFDEDLAVLIDELGLGDVRLVGQSMGGWTVLGYAVSHPQRVQALVMADTYGGLSSPEITAARDATRDRIPVNGILGGALSPQFRARNPAGGFLYDGMLALNPLRNQAPGSVSPMERISISAEEAAAFPVPTLFIEGTDDVLIPPEIIRVAMTMIPGARLEIVEDAGHSVYFERPDEFNTLLAGFLSGVGEGK